MKYIVIIFILILVGCTQVTTKSDTVGADYLCGKNNWLTIESNNTIRDNYRFIKVRCKDNSIRSMAYDIKDPEIQAP